MSSRFIVESKTTITLRQAQGGALFDHAPEGYRADITCVEWNPPSTVVTLLGWGCKDGNRDKDRPWNSVLPLDQLPEEIEKALLKKVGL